MKRDFDFSGKTFGVIFIVGMVLLFSGNVFALDWGDEGRWCASLSYGCTSFINEGCVDVNGHVGGKYDAGDPNKYTLGWYCSGVTRDAGGCVYTCCSDSGCIWGDSCNNQAYQSDGECNQDDRYGCIYRGQRPCSNTCLTCQTGGAACSSCFGACTGTGATCLTGATSGYASWTGGGRDKWCRCKNGWSAGGSGGCYRDCLIDSNTNFLVGGTYRTCSSSSHTKCQQYAGDCGVTRYCTASDGTWNWKTSNDCDDGNECTNSDDCVSGSCVGANLPYGTVCSGTTNCAPDTVSGVNTAILTCNDYPTAGSTAIGTCNNICSSGTCSSCTCTPSVDTATCNAANACKKMTAVAPGMYCRGDTYYCQYDSASSSWKWKTSTPNEQRCSGSTEVGCTDTNPSTNGGGTCTDYWCKDPNSDGVWTCETKSTNPDTCVGSGNVLLDSPSLTYYSCSGGSCASNTNNGGTDSCSDSGTNSDTGVLNGLRIGGGSCSATNWQCSGTPGVISSPSQSLSDSCTDSQDSPGLTYYTCSGTDGGLVNDNCQSNSFAQRSDYCGDSNTTSDTGVLNGYRIGKGECNSTNWYCTGSPASVFIVTANVSDSPNAASTAENPRLDFYSCINNAPTDPGGSAADTCSPSTFIPSGPGTPPGEDGDWCTDNGTQYGGGACGAQNWTVFGAGTPGDPAWVGVNSTGVLVGQGVDACGGVYSENVSYWNCSAVGGSALNTCLPAPNACGMNSSCPADKPDLLAPCSRFCANDLGLGQDWSGSGICKDCTPDCRGTTPEISGFSSLVCESVIVGNTSTATARYLVNSSPVCSPGSLVNASVSWEGSALPAFLVSVSPDCSANLWNIGFPSDANGTYVVVVNATDGSGASASCSGRRYVISATAQTPDFDLILLPVIALLGLLLARRTR